MAENLFDAFEPVSSKQWKQQIQYELKGADYNDTLVWESLEGIKVKPFYHNDESEVKYTLKENAKSFEILQNIYVHDVALSNKRALDTLNRGAESIRFTIENENVVIANLMQNLPFKNTSYFFYLPFLSIDFVNKINDYASKNNAKCFIQVDPIGQLTRDGNWFENLDKDFDKLNIIANSSPPNLGGVAPMPIGDGVVPFITINSGIYQNAGANMVQQLAYTLAHVNEYFNRIKSINLPITIEVAVGTNYFFEIAKLRALRLLFNTLAKEYNHNLDCHIIATPTKRNKTLYDYNVNMLRTTTECMSAILGGADAVANLPYDSLYHKDNEFGDRIARNQLLVLKHESYFDKVNNAADGAYYIESLTEQLKCFRKTRKSPDCGFQASADVAET